jgi:hypothetical protein
LSLMVSFSFSLILPDFFEVWDEASSALWDLR